jgi:hypothetical protein
MQRQYVIYSRGDDAAFLRIQHNNQAFQFG